MPFIASCPPSHEAASTRGFFQLPTHRTKACKVLFDHAALRQGIVGYLTIRMPYTIKHYALLFWRDTGHTYALCQLLWLHYGVTGLRAHRGRPGAASRTSCAPRSRRAFRLGGVWRVVLSS